MALGLVLMLLTSALGQTGEWLQLRGDRHMSGRAAGVGRMQGPPQELWRWDIAAWEAYAEVGNEGVELVELPVAAPVDPGYIAAAGGVWGIGPQVFDLAGAGVEVEMALGNTFKVARILPDVEGLQRFEMDDSFSDGGAEPKRGRLLAFAGGQERVVWETEPFTDSWSPNVVVVDADADGQLDIAVATHYRILVFDGATGTTKMQLRYHNYRNYGWFGAANIDADPYPEFAVVADFSMHAEVIDNDGVGLELRWLRPIQPDPAQSTKIVRPGPRALVDIDGDGRTELLYSVYNDGGDGQWHVVAVDALSGDTSYDFARRYLHGLADIDGDERPELFVSETAGEALPTYAPLAVWTLAEGVAKERWSHPLGRFSTGLLNRLPLAVNSGAADGLRTVLTGDINADGRGDFFLVEAAGAGEQIHALGLDEDGQVGQRWSVRGPDGAALETAGVADGTGLVYLVGRGAAEQGFVLNGATGVLRQWNRRASTAAGTPVVADLEGDGQVEVVVQTGTREVLCLQAPRSAGELPRPRWQVPGYGQTNNAPQHWGVVGADIDGDGDREILAAREGPSGNASLVALEADGGIGWQTEFAGFDGSMPIWNFSGLSYWNAGYFRDPGKMDVFATLRRGKLGSEVGFLLDGRSGEIVWESNGFTLSEDGSGRSLGGHPSAAGDIDGDGLEEIVVMWPDRLHIVDGLSGTAQLVRQAYGYTSGLNPLFDSDSFVGYAFPAVVDLFGDDRPELIWGHSGYLHAVLDSQGERVWQTPYRNNTQVQSLMGVGDSDGDGVVELLASTPTGARLFKADEGTVLSGLDDIGRAHTDVVAGDIDGDGRDEFLFGSGAEVVCLEWREGALRRAWTLDVGGRSSDIALADIDGDELLDIAVTTSDGYVKVYGAAAVTAVEEKAIPSQPSLHWPYPNPFNGRVQIDFSIGRAGVVQLDIFALTGQRVARLVEDWRGAGTYQVPWDAEGMGSGLYLVRLQAGGFVQQRKVILVK